MAKNFDRKLPERPDRDPETGAVNREGRQVLLVGLRENTIY
jgi:hypothetical protein